MDLNLINNNSAAIPVEMISKIFSFLEFKELTIAAQVCSLWREIVNDFLEPHKPINSLPNEMLIKVFSHLNKKALVNVRAVNDHWRETAHTQLANTAPEINAIIAGGRLKEAKLDELEELFSKVANANRASYDLDRATKKMEDINKFIQALSKQVKP